MNTIKMSKVLALIVVVAMVMAVVPCFTAFAAEPDADEVLVATATGLKYKVVDDKNYITNGSFEDADGNFSRTGWYTAEDVANNKPYGTTEIGDPYTTDHFVALDGTKGYIDLNKNGTMDEADPAEAFEFALEIPDGKWALGTKWDDPSTGLCSIRNVFAVDEPGLYALSYQVMFNGNDHDGGYLKVSKTTHKDANSTDEATREEIDAQSAGTVTKEWKTVVGVVKIDDPETEYVQFWGRWFTTGKPGYAFDDFKLRKVEEIKPNASVTANVVDGNGETLVEGFYSTDVEFYSGDTFDGANVNFDEYLLKDNNLYKVTKPGAIVLEEGDNPFNFEAELYKTVVGGNIIKNPSFEEDDEKAVDWTVTGGTPADEAIDDDGAKAFQIVQDEEGKKKTTDGKNALYLYGGKHATENQSNTGIGFEINTAWDVKPSTRYFASVDVMKTKGDKTNAYARFYVADAEGKATNKNGDEITGLVSDQFVTKQFIIETNADTAKIGFSGNWFLNDTAPIVDNFQLYELADLFTDITYTVVVTTDGTAKGTEIDRFEDQQGTAGDKVEIVAGKFVNDKRVGKEYYRSKAATIELEAGKTIYYIGADVIATINGAEAVEATTVGDYDPMLPSTVKTTVKTDEESFEAETLPVTWDGTTGTIDGTDVKVDATVNKLDKTYGLVDTISYAGQNNYPRIHDHALKLPAEISGDFAIEFEVTLNKKADNWIFLNNATADYFGPSQICLGFNGSFVAVDGNGTGGRNGSNTDAPVMALEEGQTYTILVEVDAASNKYTASIKNEAGEVAVAAGRGFRTNGKVDSLVAMSNTGSEAWLANDKNFIVSNIQVYQKDVTAPSANEITTGLNFITDGEDKDTLVISADVAGELDGKNLVVTAVDTNARTTADTVVYNNAATASAAIIPNNANITYEIKVVDTETGFATGAASAALYPMVAADITANIAEYTDAANKDQLQRVDKAVAVLSQGGAVDPKASFITVDTSTEGTTVITLSEELFANGFGFKGAIKAGTAAAVKTTAPADDNTLYSKITITGNEVTLENADSAVTFSLDAVQIEFVATEVDEADAGADADFGLVDEL